MSKYNGYKIKSIASEKFPEMVQLSKGHFTKKFVSEERAVLWIEKEKTEDLIDKQKVNVENELYETGVVFLDD